MKQLWPLIALAVVVALALRAAGRGNSAGGGGAGDPVLYIPSGPTFDMPLVQTGPSDSDVYENGGALAGQLGGMFSGFIR